MAASPETVSEGLQEKQAARRVPPDGNEPLAPTVTRMQVFDPDTFPSLRSMALDRYSDPLLHAILNLFTDKQEYGRLAYDSAYKHPVVGAAFDGRIAILTSKKPKFEPQGRNPSAKAVELADFANHLISRLDWVKTVDGMIGQGLKYGFSLGEIVTKYERWRNKLMLSLKEILPLPQPTLDNGFVPRGQHSYLGFQADGRYRCFELDKKGRIVRVRQFAYNGLTRSTLLEPFTVWDGPDLGYILHFKHKGGDGNPFGQSILYTAMEAWADLYALEKMESVFLDTALPILFGTYKTQNGNARPDIHDQVKSGLGNMYLDAIHRFLMWQDGDLKSVAPSNENFTNHVTLKKKELEERIWQSLLFPKSLVAETAASDTDSRNLVQVYFKHIIKSDLYQIGSLLEDLVYRFLESNYGILEPEEYPKCRWSLVTENEMRVAQSLLTALMPHLDSDSLPDFVHSLFDFVEPKFIAKLHKDSVSIKRPAPVVEEAGPNDPPPKEEGQTRERTDGGTDNPSGTINTST